MNDFRPARPVDPLAETQPTFPRDNLAQYQPVPAIPEPVMRVPRRPRRTGQRCGCFFLFLILLGLALLAAYLFLPTQTNIVLLGIDDRAPGGALGRSDTIVLMTFQPLERYIGMLSIPRDLWVIIPGYGENRINTAHFFAEAQQNGSGPQAVKDTIQLNFGVSVQYFVRIRFDNFMEIVDAMGGVEITLPEPMSGYPAGTHRLDAGQALAFVRERAESDDFSRMARAQILIRSLVVRAFSPANILQWPEMAQIGLNAVETDVPIFFWPRYGFQLLFVGVDGIDSRLITREMAVPFVTSQGAQVLQPRWELIQPLIAEMFGR